MLEMETTTNQATIALARQNIMRWKAEWFHNYDKFLYYLRGFATVQMLQMRDTTPFEINEQNEPIIKQLYLYLINSNECKLDTYKGIYIAGAIGAGKSVLLKAFMQVQDYVTFHTSTYLNSKNVLDRIKESGIESLAKCPLLIDDIGRESLEGNLYGNTIKPIADLMCLRYDHGALTFCTSNFNMDTLEGGKDRPGYGKYVIDRMQQMMNFIVLPGNSRRKGVAL